MSPTSFAIFTFSGSGYDVTYQIGVVDPETNWGCIIANWTIQVTI